jgi:hypothetical protein
MTDSTSEPVLACSLTAPAAAERALRWRALLDHDLLDRTAAADGLRLAFHADPAVAAELDELVAAERECCPFLTLAVTQADDRLVLDVVAPPQAAAIVEAMFEDRSRRSPATDRPKPQSGRVAI